MPPAPPTIHSTLGAVFVGFALACGVYGVLTSQIFSYFRNYPGDKLHFKLLVVLLETADQCFIGHLVYYYSIANYFNPIVLQRATMTWYFGIRVWRFSARNIWITGLVALGTISLGVGVCTDIVTAGALCFFLNRSDSLVDNLCNYAINTGVLTSTVSVATLILFNAMPANNLYFGATYFILSKLYAISFMATLNTRRAIRGRGTDHQGATSNNTNMFHLGTRMPSMGPNDLNLWDKVDPPFLAQQRVQVQGFPENSFHNYSGGSKVVPL
ncbi:hypothetical protein M413DRAFT_443844 [Hebeloma cylindrosporum]|uniref:DUF6534 domain-containing protein n=1 Tax=Hebeloma cylindrosporum TaxID=76867 RepID=A0A0C2YPR5_HEBCY|nr:hypothetical protein M413DRAFT_443844 [Hebeloma cylindrosporum h7]